MKTIHLVSNAHIDPVWLWEWEEGAAEAISTFRVAADLCEKFDHFVFNHNEVLLYQWVEEFEPALFRRIQELVKIGKWHIMGGWYVQPDCNMPSGESFVRQALYGRMYFKEKFGVEPSTAINFDPFGHTRGLVQILKKSGYDSYLFCRPNQKHCPLPSDDFIWVGYDGSEIAAHRSFEEYATRPRGNAHLKVKKFLEECADRPVGLVLWGVGNHGGGPSLADLENLEQLEAETHNVKLVHSTPERYFRELKATSVVLEKREQDINPWDIGCYTTMAQVKQKHRQLENELFKVEKFASHASLTCKFDYPAEEICEAAKDLMFAQFHDILPGTSIRPAEEASLRLMDHGLEIVSRIRTRAFFSLCGGQKQAEEGEIPILVYNPHPYKIKRIVECEFMLAEQNLNEGEFTFPHVYQDGVSIPCQAEKELSNIPMDWRKRTVFYAELEPFAMNRFDCKLEVLKEKPQARLKAANGEILFVTKELEVAINTQTGLVDRYKVNGVNMLKTEALLPLVLEDNDDPWGKGRDGWRHVIGKFELMNAEEGTKISGVSEGQTIESVRIVENGEVRTVVEVLLAYGNSYIVQTYKLPKRGTELEVDLKVHWNEKSKMLKLSVPTLLEDGKYVGQVAYGRDELPTGRKEAVAQKWVGVISADTSRAVTCINEGIYGSDYEDGEFRLSLLRSAAYSGHPIFERTITLQDRYVDRIDQGEREFRFWFNAGNVEQRMASVDREALVHNEKPFALSFFPSGEGIKPDVFMVISDRTVLSTACKQSEDRNGYIIRLFEPTGQGRTTEVRFPSLGILTTVAMGKFEIKTLRVDPLAKTVTETDLMEKEWEWEADYRCKSGP